MSSAVTAAVLSSSPEMRTIELRGVRVHNLRQIDLDIPLGKLVVLSGVSGSGKSSLAFDTIFAEGQRRYIESFSASARQFLERIERPDADRIAHVPPAIAIRTDSTVRSVTSQATVASVSEIDTALRRLFARIGRVICPGCGCEVRSQSAFDVAHAINQLSEGTRFQVCATPTTDTIENVPAAWLARGYSRAIVAGRLRSLEEMAGESPLNASYIVIDRLVAGSAKNERVIESVESAFREGNGRCTILVAASEIEVASGAEVSVAARQVYSVDGKPWHVRQFSRHWECATCQRAFLPPEVRLFESGFGGGCPSSEHATGGRVLLESKSSTGSTECPVCQGTRLSPEALAVRIGGKNLADILQLTVDQATDVYHNLTSELDEKEQELSRMALEDVQRRLGFVAEIGLGHLTLLRAARTLSGGQIRRLLLASAIGSRITGTLCVVDEPSAGLLPEEVPLVLRALRQLLNQRNSVIAVDHNPLVIREADHVIDLGPGAGPRGGSVMFAGSPDNLLNVEDSSTGRALRVERNALPGSRPPRKPADWLTLTDIQYRNLRNLTVRFPLGVLCVVSGPGGSGKSSLVADVLVPCVRDRLEPTGESPSRHRCRQVSGGDSLADVAIVDRAPLTRSSRSNAATWLEVFDDIRDVFSMTADAKQRGFGIQQFSFNAAQGGRCRACRGTGVLRHDMHFLPDVTLPCPECGGTRFRREILDVKYRGRSIADVLAMSASEAATFFRNHPRLQGRLQMLKQIGLDYLVLGQPTDTLSGGEAQRLKLAARLTSSRGPTLIVCDEATVGLHPADVTRLVACFDELLGIGHSIVVIDNSNELRREADYLIDVGPGAGVNGGRIVSEGSRLEVIQYGEQRRK